MAANDASAGEDMSGLVSGDSTPVVELSTSGELSLSDVSGPAAGGDLLPHNLHGLTGDSFNSLSEADEDWRLNAE